MERIEKRRAEKVTNRAALKSLRKLINDITEELSLDEEKMAKRIDAAFNSEYGPINGTINLLTAIANWPAEPGDGSMVSTNKQLLESKFNLDLMLLADIRASRGFHTFVTDDLEILTGEEPKYTDYSDDCEIFLAETFDTVVTKPTINKTQWERMELRAQAKAELELERMKTEVERHKEYVAQLN